jgi:hypothetical protein
MMWQKFVLLQMSQMAKKNNFEQIINFERKLPCRAWAPGGGQPIMGPWGWGTKFLKNSLNFF